MSSGDSGHGGLAARAPEVGRTEHANSLDCPAFRGPAVSSSRCGRPCLPLLRTTVRLLCRWDLGLLDWGTPSSEGSWIPTGAPRCTTLGNLPFAFWSGRSSSISDTARRRGRLEELRARVAVELTSEIVEMIPLGNDRARITA